MELLATLYDFVAISDCLAHILNESLFPFFAVQIQFGCAFAIASCGVISKCEFKFANIVRWLESP